MTPANCPSLDAFADHFLDERDALSLRSLRGEPMTEEERSRLAELDAALVRMLPRPDPMPEDVRAAIAEAMRAAPCPRCASLPLDAFAEPFEPGYVTVCAWCGRLLGPASALEAEGGCEAEPNDALRSNDPTP